MGGRGTWPVDIEPRGYVPLRCATATYRVGRETRVTAVAKITLNLTPDGKATVATAEPIVATDRHQEADPKTSVVTASELAPYLPQADVLLVGHAYAPPSTPVGELDARLLVLRDGQPVIDKTLHIQGDRVPDGSGKRPPPRPFQSSPLLWERAARSVEENPVGIDPARFEPNVLYIASRARAAGFGPIARTWPIRRNLLKKLDPKRAEGVFVDVPESFDWSYFQAAPKDQRTAHLRGDEEIVLFNMHPALPRIASRLPGLRALAQVHGVTPSPAGESLSMVLDMLTIDTDEQTASLIYRGTFAALDAALPTLKVLVAMEVPGVAAPSLELAASAQDVARVNRTVSVPAIRPVVDPALPFLPAEMAKPGPTRPSARQNPQVIPENLRARGEFTTVMPRPEELSPEPVLPFSPPPSQRSHESPAPVVEEPVESPSRISDSQRPTRDVAFAGDFFPPRPVPPPPASLDEISGVIALEDDEPTSVEASLFNDEGGPISAARPPGSERAPYDLKDTTLKMAREPVVRAIEADRAGATVPAPAPVSDSQPPSSAHLGMPSSRDTVPTAQHELRAAGLGDERIRAILSTFDGEASGPGPSSLRARVQRMVAAGETLAGAELEGADLSGLDLEGRNLSGANLVGANLMGARLRRANLTDANLTGAKLMGTDLAHARLDEACLRGADLEGASFDDTQLAGADFSSARAPRSSFVRARGGSVVFADADLTEAHFHGADLASADFAGACLEAAEMNSAVLVGATFARATATGIVLAGANLSLAVLRRARMSGANLVGANLTRASLERADLRSADLSGASVLGVDAHRADLSDALLDKAIASELKPRL